MSTESSTMTVTKIRMPSMFKVVLLNDDTTPIDFVIGVVVHVFNKSEDEARAITERVHREGRAVVDIYTQEIARQKVEDTKKLAAKYNYPLKAISEEA